MVLRRGRWLAETNKVIKRIEFSVDVGISSNKVGMTDLKTIVATPGIIPSNREVEHEIRLPFLNHVGKYFILKSFFENMLFNVCTSIFFSLL